jgi:hypothetical protein
VYLGEDVVALFQAKKNRLLNEGELNRSDLLMYLNIHALGSKVGGENARAALNSRVENRCDQGETAEISSSVVPGVHVLSDRLQGIAWLPAVRDQVFQ